jgi:uncharacterized membrane protein
MDSVNETAFFSALAVTVPTSISAVPFGPMLFGRSLIALVLAFSLITIAFTLMFTRDKGSNGWRQTGLVFLIGGVVIAIGSIEIIVALLLALIAIDILLGSFTGAERLVNRITIKGSDRSLE